jgi:hypothetical protein
MGHQCFRDKFVQVTGKRLRTLEESAMHFAHNSLDTGFFLAIFCYMQINEAI